MRVHPRDEGPARSPQADVQRLRGPARRIGQHANAWDHVGELLEDLDAAVLGTAVDEEVLGRPVEGLVEHRVDGLGQMALLVEHRDEDADVHLGRGQRTDTGACSDDADRESEQREHDHEGDADAAGHRRDPAVRPDVAPERPAQTVDRWRDLGVRGARSEDQRAHHVRHPCGIS